MSQPQYEAYARDQIVTTLHKHGHQYAQEQVDRFIDSIRNRYDSEIVGLKAEIASLKRENEMIWEKYIEDIAELRIQRRINETSNI